MARTAATNRQAVTRDRFLIRDYPYSVELTGIGHLNMSGSEILDACEEEFTCLVRCIINTSASLLASNNRFFSFQGLANDRNFECFSDQTNDSLKSRITNGVSSHINGSTVFVPLNCWNLTGMVYERGKRFGNVLNDTIYDEVTPTIDLVMNDSYDFNWMAFQGGVSPNNGFFGEGIIFNKALTQAEIADFYYRGAIPERADILLHHVPRTGSGNTVFDQSENGLDTSFNGATASWNSEEVFTKTRSAASNRTLIS